MNNINKNIMPGPVGQSVFGDIVLFDLLEPATFIMENEVWKKIPGYEGLYDVSTLGRVRSLKRGIIMKPGKHKTGYLQVNLRRGGKYATEKIHRLMAMAFLGLRGSKDERVVNHIDGNRSNNMIWNIEIVTRSENSSICFNSKRSGCTSGYIGVCWNKQRRKWKALISHGSERKYLGDFSTEEQARDAYRKELESIHGDYVYRSSERKILDNAK
jgi:hypothetical protein